MPLRRILFVLAMAICFDQTSFAQSNATESDETIVSHIPRQRVSSRGIVAIGYSKRRQILEIEFTNGAIYRYLEVPASVYRALMSSDSKARNYDDNIRGVYRSVHVRRRAQ
ncbi:MAG: hypothetical protein QOI04_1678 [Verrucomicrobiota bacterium]|jgi:hypothetical protein